MKDKVLMLSGETFKTVINSLKKFVSKDEARPILKYIKLDIKKDKVRAVACDGYRMAVLDIIKNNPEEFICYIEPLSIPKDIINTEILISENKQYITLFYLNGQAITYTRNNIVGEYINENAILPEINEDLSVTLDARMLSEIATSMKNFNGSVKIYFNENNMKPVIYKTKFEDLMEMTAIQLPVRV